MKRTLLIKMEIKSLRPLMEGNLAGETDMNAVGKVLNKYLDIPIEARRDINSRLFKDDLDIEM